MAKIKDFDFNDEAVITAKVSSLSERKTTAGSPYFSFHVFDGEEKIEAKIWNVTPEIQDTLVAGDVYIFKGRIKEYQGKKQFNIVSLERLDETQNDLSSFYEFAPVSLVELKELIYGYIDKIENSVIREITKEVIKQNEDKYFLFQAGVSLHHAYFSGLAYHCYSMLDLADVLLKRYEGINSDLVYAGIILHDVGKVVEFSKANGPSYTDSGNLMGHLFIGANMVEEAAVRLGYTDTEEVLNLVHIILSHHGDPDKGAVKPPKTLEAVVVHLCDYVDSRLAGLTVSMRDVEPGKYSEPLLMFEKETFRKANLKLPVAKKKK